jgi:hypothetical protein
MKKYKRLVILHSENYEKAIEEGKRKAKKYGIYPVKWKKYKGTFHYNSNDAWIEVD